MPIRTKLFQQFPWVGGVNTALDESTIASNQLVKAQSCVFGTRGSRKKRDGINYDWDDATDGTDSIVGLHDYWFGNPRSQRIVGVTSGKAVYSYNGGTRSADLFSGTAWSSAVTKASFETLNNQCIIAVDGSGNVMKKWNGTTFADLGVNTTTATTSSGSPTLTTLGSLAFIFVGATVTGTGIAANTTVLSIGTTTVTLSANATASNVDVTLTFTMGTPKASIVRTHLGRLWSNDKTNPDKLHYSTTANPEEWLGLGDSGAIDIGVGDGDPAGITAIFPTFKGVLFVAKKTKLYKISNMTPEDFQVELVSNGIGCESHSSIAPVDQDDMVFVSSRGVHSLQATASYGDFVGSFLSADIQPTFINEFSRERLAYCWGAYIPEINSVAFTFAENGSSTTNNALWLYNLPLKSWYSWPDVSCDSMILANDADRKRMYVGMDVTRVGKTFNSTNYDVDTSGTNQGIDFNVETGSIYVDDNPYTIKAFKRFSLYYRPVGTHTLTVSVKIDNFSPQPFTYSGDGSQELLGIDFVLGTSYLGVDAVMGPYATSIDGYGRGIKISITQSGTDEEMEIQGFGIEYETAGTQQEVRQGDTD